MFCSAPHVVPLQPPPVSFVSYFLPLAGWPCLISEEEDSQLPPQSAQLSLLRRPCPSVGVPLPLLLPHPDPAASAEGSDLRSATAAVIGSSGAVV